MKRIISICMTLLALLLMAGCSKTYKDIKVTSFDIINIVPQGLTKVYAIVDVGIDNPVVGFEIFDASATVKMDDVPALTLNCDQLVVQGNAIKVYRIPLDGKLESGFNPLQLLTLMQDADFGRFKVDLCARVNLRGGVGKVVEYKDMPLEKLIVLGKNVEQ